MKKLEVYLSPLAEFKLDLLLQKPEHEWGLKSRNEFLEKLRRQIQRIATNPESCPKSDEFEGIYKCVVSKQTSFYYRISTVIEIITITDNRQDPDTIWEEINKRFG